MTDNVRQFFDILKIEPNEVFKTSGYIDKTFYITDDLSVIDNSGEKANILLQLLLNGTLKIIKLPNPKKKKLRDLTQEEWDKWKNNNCASTYCGQCIFRHTSCAYCYEEDSWINNKDMYSDKFLDQEIEVKD